MDVYVLKGAFLCEECAMPIRAATASDDCDEYPVGPYPEGGGEADYPRHCAHCGLFLENPLTKDGERLMGLDSSVYRPVID